LLEHDVEVHHIVQADAADSIDALVSRSSRYERLPECVVAHLLQDVGVTGIIEGDGFLAVQAGDLVHGQLRWNSGWGSRQLKVGHPAGIMACATVQGGQGIEDAPQSGYLDWSGKERRMLWRSME
jgi:hypothetical protein